MVVDQSCYQPPRFMWLSMGTRSYCTMSRGRKSWGLLLLAPGLRLEGSCAGGSTSVCPGAWKLGSSEPKTVAVVKAKPAGSAHHPGPGEVGCHPWPHLAI